MADMRQIHEFAVKWCDKFRDQNINYVELVDHYMADDCAALGFEMDCGHDFTEKYGDAASKVDALDRIIKPIYTEIQKLSGPRLMGFYRENRNGNRVQLASDPSDVRLQCGLEESIEELRQFDNSKLFPYISELFAEIERVLDPSPFV